MSKNHTFFRYKIGHIPDAAPGAATGRPAFNLFFGFL
jgi:hypothetical protein